MVRLPPSLSKTPVEQSRLSREALSEQQRERILVAMTEVFAKRGFQASTIDHLVASAKIGVGSFYTHFDGKDDCLVQVYEKVVVDARSRILNAMDGIENWGDRAVAGLYALLRFIVAEPLAARVALLEVQTGGPEPVRRYNETLREAASALRSGRAESKQDPELPPSLEDATASGLAWLLQGRLARGEVKDRDIDTLFREMAGVALEPYLGIERTERAIQAFLASSP